jgi:RNA polymerase sigma-70 factor (ECF subfamily)
LVDLVSAARRGDAKARQALFLSHHRGVRTLVLRILGHAQDVDDIVNDTFVQALRGLPRLRNEKAFPSWLNGIAVSCTHYFMRRRRFLRKVGIGHAEPVDVDVLVSGDAPADVRADVARLYQALNALPEKPRIALVMRRVEGRPLEEIAEAMRTSLSSVKRWIAQAEAHVRHPRAGDAGERRARSTRGANR